MEFEPVSQNFTIKLPGLVVNHTLNAVFGFVFGLFNIPLLVTLLSTKSFRAKYFTLIVLCLADSSNCIAIFLMGINRVTLYSNVISTLSVPVRTSWECAMEPWLWFRGIGDLWPPMVQVIMGLEKGFAVFLPTHFKKLEGLRTRMCMAAISVVYVLIVMISGFTASWQNKDEKAKYYCGRKAAFSAEYGQYIYLSNIICYSFGVIVCGLTYWKCTRMNTQNNSTMQRVRYALVICIFSTVLVSIPNGISMLKQYISIADVIAKPSVYASSFNSGINLFIYLALSTEFRQRFFQLTRIQKQGTAVVSTVTMSKSRFTKTN